MASDNPFSPVHSRQSFLETSGCGEALRRLDEGLGEREPFLIVTGEPGVGKTALATEAIARWDARVAAAHLAYSTFMGSEFLEEIIRRLGAEPPEGGSRSKLLAGFEHALAGIAQRGQLAMLVIDDAHTLSLEHLEELRLLANAAQRVHRPLEVMLVGLPSIHALLEAPVLASLRQRVAVRVRLEPLPPAETKRYLQHRITASGGDGPGTFPKKTCREIAARTGGVPRRINTLAAEALRVARAWGDTMVGLEHVQTAAAELGGFLPASLEDDEAPAPAETPRPVPAAIAKPAETRSQPHVAPAAVAPVAPPPAVRTAAAPPKVSAPAKQAKPAKAPKPAATPPAPPREDPSTIARAVERHVKAPATPAAAAAGVPAAPPAEPAKPPLPADPGVVEDSVRVIVPAENHDPREWVARFVGDKGPLQISAHARLETGDWDEPLEGDGGEAAPAAGAPPPPRRRKDRGRPRGRSRHRGPSRALTTALLATAAGVAAVALLMRIGALPGFERAAVPVVADGRRAPAPVAAVASRSQVRSAERPTARVVSEGSAERPAPETSSAPAALPGPYTLEVGARGNYASALAERDRVAELTGIRGWVIDDDGTGTYRIVVGIFSAQSRARSAANMLVRSRTLPNVDVVTLPPPHLRN